MTQTLYKISRWKESFETSDSRRFKRLNWVRLPNDLDLSNGYQSLTTSRTDSAEIYGAWCALVCIASKMPERGVLATSRGVPLSLDRLSVLTRLPKRSLKKMIDWATSPEIGWIETQQIGQTEFQTGCDPGATQARPRLRNVTERNVTERNNKSAIPTIDDVRAYCESRNSSVDPEYFWNYYEAREWKFPDGRQIKKWKNVICTWEQNDQRKRKKTRGEHGERKSGSLFKSDGRRATKDRL